MIAQQRLLISLSIQESSGKVDLFSEYIWLTWPGSHQTKWQNLDFYAHANLGSTPCPSVYFRKPPI